MAKKPDISVVVPAYNEDDLVGQTIPRFVASLAAQRRSFELIVVNDGSRDGTGPALDRLALDEPRLRVIHFTRNFGQTAAMMAGFLAARGDVIVALDADGQNEPDDIEMLVDRLEQGFDVVSGWRRDRQDAWLRTRVSRVANWIIGRVTGVKLHDYGCTLKAYRAPLVRDARLFGEMHRFIPIFTAMHGARIDEMVVRHHPRTAGRSKYGYGRVMRVALDIALVRMLQRYRTKPLHFFGKITQYAWLGTLACFGFAGLQAVLSADPWKAFWGKAPLIGTILFVLGFIAIMSGLVAELVMRAGYEPVGGRYWEVARATNLDEPIAAPPRSAPIERVAPVGQRREKASL